MSISSFCIEQREKENEALKKLLLYSLMVSGVVHIGIFFGLNLIPPEEKIADEPIEIILLEEPEVIPEPEVPEPPDDLEPEPEPVETKIQETVRVPLPPNIEPEPEPQVSEPEPIPQPQTRVNIPKPSPVIPSPVETEPEPIARNEEITPSITEPVESTPTDNNNSELLTSNQGTTNSSSGSQGDNNNSGNNTTGTETAAVSPPPTVPRQIPLPLSAGGGCAPGKKPEFPRSLANRGIEARPVIRITTDTNGTVVNASISQSSGYPQLDRAALRAASRTRCPKGNIYQGNVVVSFAQPGTDFERDALRRQAELERQREAAERQRQAELEQQRRQEEATNQNQIQQEEAERQRQAELERQRREQEALRQRQQEEAERQRQVEIENQQREQQQQDDGLFDDSIWENLQNQE